MTDRFRPAMAAAALLAPLIGLGSPAAAAPPPTTTAAAIAALERVCRPSTEENVRVEVSVTRLGYPSVDVPPNLPTGRPLHAWAAPSPGPGKIYVLDGGLPESAQAGCILAVYGESLPRLAGEVQAQLTKDSTGFAQNPTVTVSGPRQAVTRFDRRHGRVVTSITVIQPAQPRPEAPSALIAVSRVDYGWLDKFGG